ncbi:MAG TPA: nucleotide exchange factor GrpE [Verrucomicrobiota bacterium]|nr:nucleotide exchange factor GrpE [Verrucomicrobiota bacterium]HNU51234.1 nucleotide exchange factor GrpE [Verrucomicrobiota bacterium]
MSAHTDTVHLGPRFFAPFVLGDILLVATAGLIFLQADRPMSDPQMLCVAACVLLAAVFGVLPFELRRRAELRLIETGTLVSTLSQIQQLESLAQRIEAATSQWQTAQEHAASTTTAAREIADRIAAEHAQFQQFLTQANDAERSHLRLEVDKLRRAEGDWLQVLVRVLDHVYALHFAAVRSGQANLIEQLSHFQNACRDAARRVGLTPLTAAPGVPFDPEHHQLPDSRSAVPENAVVADTIATGYVFQGRLLRRTVVAVRVAPSAPAASNTPEDPAPAESNSMSFGLASLHPTPAQPAPEPDVPTPENCANGTETPAADDTTRGPSSPRPDTPAPSSPSDLPLQY